MNFYDEDEEETESKSAVGRVSDFYLFRVFREYGLMYGMLLLFFTLCYVIVLLPITAKYLFEGLCILINIISGGNQDIWVCCWIFLGTSLMGILAIWITIKICDRKYHLKEEK